MNEELKEKLQKIERIHGTLTAYTTALTLMQGTLLFLKNLRRRNIDGFDDEIVILHINKFFETLDKGVNEIKTILDSKEIKQ